MPDIDDKNRKCGLYVRVSTQNQAEEGESLDEQIERLKNFCKYKGWSNVTIYREEGFSGKDTKRPEFQRMMADIHKGKINTVIVKKIDRLSRSIIDFENIYKIFETKEVDLISLQENFDTSTALGRGVIRIVLVFAQLEREQTSERTIDVLAYRAKQGLFNGGYPRLGYDIDYENKCLVPNKSEIPVLREAFKLYVEKGSLSETAKVLNTKGYRMKSWTSRRAGRKRGGYKFNKNSLARILKDPTYIGKTRYKGQTYEGQHPAIIDESLFHTVQSMINANYTTKTGYRQDGHKFLLKGLVKCASCHTAMIPSFSISKGKEYYYYRCKTNEDSSRGICKIGSVNARQLESLVVEELKFLANDPGIVEGVVESATKEQKQKVKEILSKKKVLQDKLIQVDKKARNLLDIIGDKGKGGHNTNYLLKELDGLDEQAKQLKKEIDFIDFEANKYQSKIINAETVRDNFKVFKDVYDHLTTDERFDLMHLLIKGIVYYEDSEPDRTGKKNGKIKMDLWELPSIDPQNLNSANGFAESIAWRGGRGSNPRPPT